MPRASRIIVLALLGAFAVPVPALADPPPPAAIDQYTEQVPSAAKHEPKAKAPRALPPEIRAKLKAIGGSTAAFLEQSATSTTYGAPPERPSGTTGQGRRPGADETSKSKGSAVAAARAASSSAGSSAVWILIGLLLGSAGVTVAWLRLRGPGAGRPGA